MLSNMKSQSSPLHGTMDDVIRRALKCGDVGPGNLVDLDEAVKQNVPAGMVVFKI